MKTASLLAVALASISFFVPDTIRAADSAGCSGIVADENAVPVGSAQVKLVNSASQSFQTETDEAGHFAFAKLPPGDYRVEVRKTGFFVLVGQTFTLSSGHNELALTLNHEQELHEKVQVTATSNRIDPQDTSQRSVLTARNIRDIPVPSSHVLQQSLIAMPEIVQDNAYNLHVAGARSGDTQYLLDGFEIGDPVNGALTARFNIDAARAAEVQTGRVAAAYAHSGAGTLSLETPDGDDRWRFGTTNPIPGINVQEGVHLGNWYPRCTFSGPIERGRFWFSDAISIQHSFTVVKELQSGANTSEQWAGDNLLRLQYNFSAHHILHASYLYNRAQGIYQGLDALDPQSTTVTTNQRRSFLSLKDQMWWRDTLLELGVAGDSDQLDYTPQGALPYLLFVDGTGGNYFQQLQQHGRRLQGFGNLFAASRHWHGTHQLAAGFNAAGLRYSQAAQRGEIQAFNAAVILVRQSIFAGAATPSVTDTQAGGYVQDTWTITKRFVLQTGIRADWDGFTGNAIAEPRISANVLPFGDDRAKLSLGWGIYAAPLNLSLIGQARDQQQLDSFYDPTGTIVVTGPVVSQFVLPSAGLQQPRFSIYSLGWQQTIWRKTLVGLELLARNGAHGFAYVDQQPAQPGGIFLLQDSRKDTYRAATFSARHSFSENTELFAAYTWSSAHSNEVLNPALGSIFYAPQQPGPLAWDAPNRLLTWGWAPTHIWGLLFSYFFEYRTGYPYSAVNLQQQLVGAPNSLRFPAYVNVNVALEKKFTFRHKLWAIRGEAVNILNRQNPNTVVNNTDAPTFGTFSGGQGLAFTARLRFVGRK